MSKHQVLVPLVTPLDAQGAVCRQSVQQLVYSCAGVVSGFIPCLTSGEGWRLSEQQWADMLLYTLEFASDSHRVVAGIELPSTEAVIQRAALAEQLGAKAIMVTSPFGGQLHQDQLLSHYQRIHEQVPLELLIYNEAALSGNEKSFETLLQIARLPRVTGLKDSPTQPPSQAQVDRLRSEGIDYFIGWEHQLAGTLLSDGNVVSLANIEPTLCRIAAEPHQPAIAGLVEALDKRYGLGEEDWYAHVKRELVGRGVIGTALTVQERER